MEGVHPNYCDVTLTPSCCSFPPLAVVFGALFNPNSSSKDIYISDRFCPGF